jgi:protein-tyrosine phosphatase
MRDLIASIPGVRPLVRAVRHLPDRLLHPLRRRRALRALASSGPVRRIVVLCLGNINRSAYAAALLRTRLGGNAGEGPTILSAGFIGPDRPSPPEAIAIAAERGIDLSGHRSRLVSAELLRDADLVLVMNRTQRDAVLNDHGFRDSSRVLILGDLDPPGTERREIRDPYDQERGVYEASFSRIERCLEALVSTISVKCEAQVRG